MSSFSYTLTIELKTNLQITDALRIKLLSTPLSPKAELKLRWEAQVDRVYYSLLLSDIKINKKDIISTLSTSSYLRKPKKLTNEQKLIIKYKKAMDVISNNWLVTDKVLTSGVVIALQALASENSYRTSDTELKQTLDYLQTGIDHPVVQAAIAYAALSELHFFSDGNGRISRLIALLFLYKNGFDVRGLICMEKVWYENRSEFREALNQGLSSVHATRWIEYFAESLRKNLEERQKAITTYQSTSESRKSFTYLNERQKEILNILDEPSSTITNRNVQKYFGISQITASRDLAHLATVGLIIPRGKGRSVYYTKV